MDSFEEIGHFTQVSMQCSKSYICFFLAFLVVGTILIIFSCSLEVTKCRRAIWKGRYLQHTTRFLIAFNNSADGVEIHNFSGLCYFQVPMERKKCCWVPCLPLLTSWERAWTICGWVLITKALELRKWCVLLCWKARMSFLFCIMRPSVPLRRQIRDVKMPIKQDALRAGFSSLQYAGCLV